MIEGLVKDESAMRKDRERRIMDATGDEDRDGVGVNSLGKEIADFGAVRVEPLADVFGLDPSRTRDRVDDEKVEATALRYHESVDEGGRFLLGVEGGVVVLGEIGKAAEELERRRGVEERAIYGDFKRLSETHREVERSRGVVKRLQEGKTGLYVRGGR